MYEFLEYRVEDVMTRNLITLPKDATVQEAEALFEKHDVDALPVIDRSREVEGSGRLLGIVTKLDLLNAFRFGTGAPIPSYESILAGGIAEAMNPHPSVVAPATPLTRVLEKLVTSGVKSLPVMEDGALVGIVSREDVLRGIRRAANGEPSPSRAE